MSYGYFAEFYDSFTDDVNYDKIEKFVCSLLSREGINGGLLLDLACGTGSLAVRLSEKGYSRNRNRYVSRNAVGRAAKGGS